MNFERQTGVPAAITSLLAKHKLKFVPGLKYDVADLDDHFDTLKTPTEDRMMVKSVLRQLRQL
jgi:hypothetical protein